MALFDTLDAARAMCEEGLGQAAAEAVAKVCGSAASHGQDGIVTKPDLDQAKAELRTEISEVRVEISEVKAEMSRMESRLIRWVIGSALTLIAVQVALFRILPTLPPG